MIDAGLIDAAVVGGVDSLCLTTLVRLQLARTCCRRDRCRPFDRGRNGISIGEARGLRAAERAGDRAGRHRAARRRRVERRLSHVGAASARAWARGWRCEQRCRTRGLAPAAIDYINLHGTATPANDAAEVAAVRARVRHEQVACSSTKGATGHALGAAGAIEAVISGARAAPWLHAGRRQHAGRSMPRLPLAVICCTTGHAPSRCSSNSFGFGGTNCSLVLGRRMRAAAGHDAGPRCLDRRASASSAPACRTGRRAEAVLRGERPYVAQLCAAAGRADVAACRTPARRPRCVKLALAVGYQAAAAAGRILRRLATVFAASGADGDICTKSARCSRPAATARFPRPVSTTRCTTLPPATGALRPTGAKAPSTSLCAYDGSFGAGLLEASMPGSGGSRSRLLIAYDTGYPEPLHRVRPIPDAFGIALRAVARTRERHAGVASMWSLRRRRSDVADRRALEALRTGYPAARGLPLLMTLAQRAAGIGMCSTISMTAVARSD